MDAGQLDRALTRLVADGTLTDDQAQAVRGAVLAEAGRRTIPPVAEALGYLGAVLATAAAVALASTFWDQLAVWGQTAILALVSAALLGAGWLARSDDEAASRLSGFCWLLSVAAFAGAVGVAVDGGDPRGSPDGLLLLVAVPTLLYGGVLWWLRRGALQLLAPFLAAVTAVIGVFELAERPPSELYGAIIWACGGALLALGVTGVVAPPRAAGVLGAVAALVGTQVLYLGADGEGWGVVLTVVTAVVLLLLGASRPDRALLGLGAVAAAVAVPEVLELVAPGAVGGPGVVLLVGIGLLAAALVAIRGGGRADRHG